MKKWFEKFGLTMLIGMLSAFLLTGCTEEEVDQFITIVLSENSSAKSDTETESIVSHDSPESSVESDFWLEDSDETLEESLAELSEEFFSETEETDRSTDVSEESKPSTGDLNDPAGPGAHLDEYGTYTGKEDVAEYLHTYNNLPENFITKKEAEELGWTGGSLEEYAPGMCIGGDRFGNYEKLLPVKKGRIYYECDIDTLGAKKRGTKRIVYSNDGLIYYTEDHYESFTLLYGEE
ncbi:MAG: ribonuclease domain-containing protein [Acetatifactor sp.]